MLRRIYRYSFVTLAVLFIGLLFGLGSQPIHAFTTNPTPTRHYVVDDYADILDDETKDKVIHKEKFYKHHTVDKPQVVMMTVPNSHSESVTDYSDDLLEHNRWHFGEKKYNNGVLILFARNHGKNNVRISTGYGVESILTDIKTHHFLVNNEKLLKSHSNTKINKGLRNVFSDVTRTLDAKYAHLTKKQAKALVKRHQRKKIWEYILIAIVALLIAVPPYDGDWFCGLWLALDLLDSFDDDDDDDDDDSGFGGFSDSGSGGSFGGGGSSI